LALIDAATFQRVAQFEENVKTSTANGATRTANGDARAKTRDETRAIPSITRFLIKFTFKQYAAT